MRNMNCELILIYVEYDDEVDEKWICSYMWCDAIRGTEMRYLVWWEEMLYDIWCGERRCYLMWCDGRTCYIIYGVMGGNAIQYLVWWEEMRYWYLVWLEEILYDIWCEWKTWLGLTMGIMLSPNTCVCR